MYDCMFDYDSHGQRWDDGTGVANGCMCKWGEVSPSILDCVFTKIPLLARLYRTALDDIWAFRPAFPLLMDNVR